MQIKTKIVSGHTADSKPVKQENNGSVKLPPLVFPEACLTGKASSVFSLLKLFYLSMMMISNKRLCVAKTQACLSFRR